MSSNILLRSERSTARHSNPMPQHRLPLFTEASLRRRISLSSTPLPLPNSTISSSSHPLLPLVIVLHHALVKCIQRFQIRILLPENIPLDEPRQPSASLIGHELASGYGEDVVEFFEGALLQSVISMGKMLGQ